MDTEAKKLFKAKAWAIDAPANRAELNNSNITPAINRGNGWDSTFSQSGGNLPDRRHFNQILCEMFSAAKEVLFGVSPYDEQVNYPVDAFTQVKGALWRASVATGPATNNAINPTTANQNVWIPITGSRAKPDAPEAFLGTPSNQSIVVQWKAGQDNGSKITRWKVEHKEASQEWDESTATTVNYPYINLVNLSAGTQYKVRASAENDIDTGEWGESPIGGTQFTTTGTRPAGGDLLALLATPGDGEVDLRWAIPNNGGYPIIRYTIQWAERTDAWDDSNALTNSTNTVTVPNLTNGTPHRFRVKAANQVGAGDWSNIAHATPVSSAVATYPPNLSAPTLQVTGTTTISAQPNDTPSARGVTAEIKGFNWSIKRREDATWTTKPVDTSKSYGFENLDPNTVYEVRYTVTTSLGESTRSPTSVATTQSASTPNVSRAQPIPQAPSVSYQSSSRGVSLSSRHESDSEFALYTINSTEWQYQRVGTSTWHTLSATGRTVSIPYPTINIDDYSYEFRFRYNTTGGLTGFSPVARQNRRIPRPGPVRNLSVSVSSRQPSFRLRNPDSTHFSLTATWSRPSVGSENITQTEWYFTFGRGFVIERKYSRNGFQSSGSQHWARDSIHNRIYVHVRVRNNTGWGPWTSASTAI